MADDIYKMLLSSLAGFIIGSLISISVYGGENARLKIALKQLGILIEYSNGGGKREETVSSNGDLSIAGLGIGSESEYYP